MSSIENMIAWMQARKGKVTYSMTSRMGPKSYDCSSSVFFAMIAGGFLSSGSMGNTETLFGMSGTKLKEISRGEVQRGISSSQALQEVQLVRMDTLVFF
ncbi:hypothetical protein V4HA_01809 [Lactococcus cremoris]|nr:hypothetical protein [Lactococcus cremoris]